MSNKGDKQHLFDNPRNVRRVIQGLLVACAILASLDFVIHRHVVHPWEETFAFYAVYGFVACVMLVLLAKELRKMVMRAEDYYGPVPEPRPFADDGKDDTKGDAKGSAEGGDA
jgi:hypothetical protein